MNNIIISITTASITATGNEQQTKRTCSHNLDLRWTMNWAPHILHYWLLRYHRHSTFAISRGIAGRVRVSPSLLPTVHSLGLLYSLIHVICDCSTILLTFINLTIINADKNSINDARFLLNIIIIFSFDILHGIMFKTNNREINWKLW